MSIASCAMRLRRGSRETSAASEMIAQPPISTVEARVQAIISLSGIDILGMLNVDTEITR